MRGAATGSDPGRPDRARKCVAIAREKRRNPVDLLGMFAYTTAAVEPTTVFFPFSIVNPLA